ncbi:MAG TPA: cytochrome c, partial [Flammeovirgaceae bacterium]|nr:cytochrome c [Flammeovirgaceae bacterium]
YESVTNSIPKKTHADQITDAVRRGREIWDKNNCMGCHTILGEGAYYAPELTRVYSRKGETYIKTVLMSKTPWAPRGRKMVAYGMSEKEANDVVAFFKWVNEMDLNGFPPEPDKNLQP